MAKGKGKIKGWITKNGVHIPIYDHYTVREGHEPGEKSLKSKFKSNKKEESTNLDKRLMSYIPSNYKSLVTDIYEGEEEWNDVTQRNNTPLIVEWENGEVSNFANKAHARNTLKEFHSPEEFKNQKIKKDTTSKETTSDLRKSIEKDIRSKMETHWKWAGEDKDRFATTDTKSVMTRVDTMLDHFKGKDIITPGEDSEVPGEIKWKFTGRDKNTGKRASFDFSEAPNPEKAKESLRKNGYQVSSYNIYPEQIYNYLFNHTNVDDYDKMAAQALSKQALSDWRKKHKEK